MHSDRLRPHPIVWTLIVVFCPRTLMGHELSTHHRLAMASAQKADRMQDFLRELQLSLQAIVTSTTPTNRVKNEPGAGPSYYEECSDFLDRAQGTAADWLRVGSILEDRLHPTLRNCTHFYTPDSPTSGYRPCSVTRPFCCPFDNAVDHARDLWDNALDELVAGLTLPSKIDRKDSLIDGFISLGEVLHLLHDLSAPDHTRDDLHLCFDLFCPDPSSFHMWGDQNRAQVVALASTAYNNSAFLTLDQAFNFQANVTAQSYFSDGTILLAPNAYVAAIEPQWGLLNNPNATYLIRPGTQEFVAWYPSCVIGFGGGGLFDPIVVPQSLEDAIALRHCARLVGDPGGIVLQNYANGLYPVTTQYGSHLLNYFFRARLSAKIERTDPAPIGGDYITITVQNTSRVAGDDAQLTIHGQPKFFLDDRDGNRWPLGILNNATPPSTLARGASFTTQIWCPPTICAPDTQPTRRIYVVYDGEIGDERGIAATIAGGGLPYWYFANGDIGIETALIPAEVRVRIDGEYTYHPWTGTFTTANDGTQFSIEATPFAGIIHATTTGSGASRIQVQTGIAANISPLFYVIQPDQRLYLCTAFGLDAAQHGAIRITTYQQPVPFPGPKICYGEANNDPDCAIRFGGPYQDAGCYQLPASLISQLAGQPNTIDWACVVELATEIHEQCREIENCTPTLPEFCALAPTNCAQECCREYRSEALILWEIDTGN